MKTKLLFLLVALCATVPAVAQPPPPAPPVRSVIIDYYYPPKPPHVLRWFWPWMFCIHLR